MCTFKSYSMRVLHIGRIQERLVEFEYLNNYQEIRISRSEFRSK